MWQYISNIASLESNIAGIFMNVVNLVMQHWSHIATRSDVIWVIFIFLEQFKVMYTYRQMLECVYLLQIIIELLTKKIEYSIYIYGPPDRAVFSTIY